MILVAKDLSKTK